MLNCKRAYCDGWQFERLVLQHCYVCHSVLVVLGDNTSGLFFLARDGRIGFLCCSRTLISPVEKIRSSFSLVLPFWIPVSLTRNRKTQYSGLLLAEAGIV